MTKATTTFNSDGTFTTSPYLLDGSVSAEVAGGRGGGNSSIWGWGDIVTGTITAAASEEFWVYAGPEGIYG
ncbi:MAG TPA: hypothetical protein VNV87_08765, partial [Acidimicrobiales bacterium]|nr:hypothetical protein [Acidimicrobiales bacterium]